MYVYIYIYIYIYYIYLYVCMYVCIYIYEHFFHFTASLTFINVSYFLELSKLVQEFSYFLEASSQSSLSESLKLGTFDSKQ